jgi:hypothetical protein
MLRKFFEYGLVLSILYASLLLILLTLPYIHFIPGIEFLETKQLIYHIDWWRWSFYIHIFSSPVVIISGIIQFNRSLQQKKPVLHRKIGNLYVLFVLFISGPSGLIMSFYANAGYPAQISFVTLSMLWILSTFLGYYTIRNGNRKKHVLWMFRSYALTLSAVTLRFYAYLFDVFKIDLPPQETYILLAYISWIPNLLFVEILNKAGYLKTYS